MRIAGSRNLQVQARALRGFAAVLALGTLLPAGSAARTLPLHGVVQAGAMSLDTQALPALAGQEFDPANSDGTPPASDGGTPPANSGGAPPANGGETSAENSVDSPSASVPVRERVLSSIVGIRATLTTPRLSFRGRRRIEADEIPSRGSGTGVVIGRTGVILTCAHLVEEATSVRVFLPDDREVPGRVVVVDRASDLALVNVDTTPLIPLDIQSPPVMRQGEQVYLASRPGGATVRFEPGELATMNIFHLGHTQLEFFRRFIVGIEPGDSGGALVDREGRFLGLASVGHPEGGMGYAIAREFVIVALARLRAGKPVVWPWLGIGVETPPGPPGILIWTVAPGSPAQAAGLKPGDRIVSLDERPVQHFLPAMMTVVSKPIGTRFKLGVVRLGASGSGAAGGEGPGAVARQESPQAQKGGSAAVAGSRGSSTEGAMGPPGEPQVGPAPQSAPGAADQGAGGASRPDGQVRGADPRPASLPAQPAQDVTIISATRPIEPVLPPIDLMERLTGIRLAVSPATQVEQAGLKVEAFTASPIEGSRPCAVGSRLVAIVPGERLVHALEEGREDQEVKINTVADLGTALRAAFEGARTTAVLIWSTNGKQETMLLSGETNHYPLM